MKGGASMKLVVASRQAPRIVREAKTPDDAIRIVREAIENDRTLVAVGENRVDDGEALELTSRVLDALRPVARRVLARRLLARTWARRMVTRDLNESFMDGMERELRREGHL
jgi:FAD/FMN-containing dehydrogenase